MEIKKFAKKWGLVSRFKKPLPKETCIIQVLIKDSAGINIRVCQWNPRAEDNDTSCKGYLGTARVLVDPYKGIGFNVWKQNKFEFFYYKIIKELI